MREDLILDVKEKVEGGVKDCVKISHSSRWENGNMVMENGQEEKSVNVRQAVRNAEEKFIRVFGTGERENRLGSFPCMSQRKSLGIIGVSTNYIPVKQTLYFHRKVYVQHPVLAQPVPLPSFRPTMQGVP